MRHKASVVFSVAAAIALVVAGSASGGFTSEVTVKFKPVSETKLKYKGKVSAIDASCRKGRVISFKSEGRRLAKTESKRTGKFSVVGKRPDTGSEIQVKVKPKGSKCPKLAVTGIAP